jgi:UDP-N-acetylmuramoyl-L-alanyl-D-glutamate--2,6-diaminopimelate ligase
MRLSELLRRAQLDATVPEADVEIAAVTDRSNEVAPGSLFIAIQGVAADGHAFVGEAVRNGAAAVVGSKPKPAEAGSAIYLQVSNTRIALARLLHAFHDFPMRDMLVIGVTGTNGKSTTAYLIEAILTAAGRRPGLIGTIEYRYGTVADLAAHTTPHPAILIGYAEAMRRAGVDALVLEVSSHALVQHRVECVPFRVAVLTNVTHDHFDFHGTREAYVAAKWKFFAEVLPHSPDGVAVFNLDDPVGVEFNRRYRSGAGFQPPMGRILTYGSDPAADVRLRALEGDRSGMRLVIEVPGGTRSVRSHLCGDYNVSNLLAAIAAGLAADLPLDAIVAGIESLRGVPGRFERIETGAPFDVYVDFAHTPDALDHVLESARRLVGGGRLFCVFGAGGDRDPSKRAPMGAAVARHADRAIITKDNSRFEDPHRIAAMVASGMASAQLPRCRWDILLDRREAIRTALSEAQPGDLVLIAGKGHELYESEGGQLRPWDDRAVVRELLTTMKKNDE